MGFYTRFKDEAARQEIVRYYRFLEQNDNIFRGNRSQGEVLLLYPRTKVRDGDIASVEAFRQLGKKLLDQHVLFDILPDDRLTSTTRASYRVILDASKPSDLPGDLSKFTAPATVRVSASIPKEGKEVTVHFVNYNREEPMPKRSPGGGIKDEKPLAVEGFEVDFVLPKGVNRTRVLFLSPESPDPLELKHTIREGRIQFEVPKFLVYGLARIQFVKE